MSDAANRLIQAAAGNAGEAVYVDDVFSTYLYEGNGTNDNATNQIQNGIDLSGEGGLVWIKKRSGGSTGKSHTLVDSERGADERFKSETTDSSFTGYEGFISFNSDGFTVGKSGELQNANGRPYVSWSFRKQPGFFDVVTWTGNSTGGRTISHNLGSVPGMIIVKRTDSTGAWQVYHRANTANPETDYLVLNTTAATNDSLSRWNDTAPTSTEFTLGNSATLNYSGGTYVAYLFAHDDQRFGENEDESIIKCGSFTTDGSGFSTSDIDLGFEPQWLMIKRSQGGIGDWLIYDVMRGITPEYESTQKISANTNAFETGSGQVALKSTGFGYMGSTNSTYVYVAIRRPHKPASEFAATDLFGIDLTSAGTPAYDPGFTTDFIYQRAYASTQNNFFMSRLTGSKYLLTESTNAEATGSSIYWDYQTGAVNNFGNTNYAGWCFRRAPGFFDVVSYTGTNSEVTVPHNLGVVPELIINKARTSVALGGWYSLCTILPSGSQLVRLDSSNAAGNEANLFPTAPTASNYYVDSLASYSGATYVSYLFATVSGISKVGTYTGTGSDVNVDCGFSAGARFVLIKRTDGTAGTSVGDWYVWDSERGIVAGNDPYLLLNSTAAQVTTTDYIDPLSSGFTVTSSAPAALNASGGTYLFLAIA